MPTTIAEKFLARCISRDGCLIWTGAKDAHGYGSLSISGITRKAHRIAYELFVGPIPEGLHILHKCDVRDCVNPNHLYPGTDKDNVRDMLDRGRHRYISSGVNQNTYKTICKNGHKLSADNVYIRPDGSRSCRTCQRSREEVYRAKQNSKAS